MANPAHPPSVPSLDTERRRGVGGSRMRATRQSQRAARAARRAGAGVGERQAAAGLAAGAAHAQGRGRDARAQDQGLVRRDPGGRALARPARTHAGLRRSDLARVSSARAGQEATPVHKLSPSREYLREATAKVQERRRARRGQVGRAGDGDVPGRHGGRVQPHRDSAGAAEVLGRGHRRAAARCDGAASAAVHRAAGAELRVLSQPGAVRHSGLRDGQGRAAGEPAGDTLRGRSAGGEARHGAGGARLEDFGETARVLRFSASEGQGQFSLGFSGDESGATHGGTPGADHRDAAGHDAASSRPTSEHATLRRRLRTAARRLGAQGQRAAASSHGPDGADQPAAGRRLDNEWHEQAGATSSGKVSASTTGWTAGSSSTCRSQTGQP